MLAAAWFTAAQRPEAQERVILEYADTLRSRGEERELIGSVRVRRGETRIQANRALHSPEQGLLRLTGSVRLDEPTRRVRSQTMRYDEASGDFVASGAVDVHLGDSLRIRCATAHYREVTRLLELDGDVIIDIYSDSSRITGGWGRFNLGDSSGTIEGSPVYRLPELGTADPETLVIESQRLQFSRRDRSALFTGEVRLNRQDLLAVADTLYHEPDSNRTQLGGAPLVWRGEDELSGNAIALAYRGRQVSKMEVTGNAVALSLAREGDDRRNRLSGRSLVMEMIDDSTRFPQVAGNAVGRYFVWDENESYQGLNLATGDTISILVVAERSRRIEIVGRANGSFYPAGMEPMEALETPLKRKTAATGE